MKDSNEILGGYNPIIWKSDDSFGITKDSFIFSFKNKNIGEYILSRVCKDYAAIYNSAGCCSSFNGDLFLCEESGNCHKIAYDKLIRETVGYFPVEEYEIFQITKDW